jgi:hypothetical protein
MPAAYAEVTNTEDMSFPSISFIREGELMKNPYSHEYTFIHVYFFP